MVMSEQGSAPLPERPHFPTWFVVPASLVFLVIALLVIQRDQGNPVAPTPTTTGTKALPTRPGSPPPILYVMNDWANIDYGSLYPEWGPVGGWWQWRWSEVHAGPGRFDFSKIDAYLDQAMQYTVLLPDGTVISKPVGITIMLYSVEQGQFWDATPQWVYQRIGDRPTITYGDQPPFLTGYRLIPPSTATCPNGQPMAAPLYDNRTWQDYHAEMVRAFGARYDRDPRVSFVFISTGIDGETQATKAYRGCDYEKALLSAMGGTTAAFEKWVLDTIALYRQAFPTKPVFIQNAAGRGRLNFAQKAATLTPPIGLHLNGLTHDGSGWYGYLSDTGKGQMEMAKNYNTVLPIFFEPAYFVITPQNTYYMLLAALSYHTDYIDLQQRVTAEGDVGYFTLLAREPWLIPFVINHLGKTIQNTPDVWIALRTTDYPPDHPTCQGWCSGEVGDFTYWLYRPEGIAGNATAIVPAAALPPESQGQIYSWKARRTLEPANPYMSFDIDNAYPYVGQPPVSVSPNGVGYEVTVWLINQEKDPIQGDTIALEYKDYAGKLVTRAVRKGVDPFGLGTRNTWVSYTWTLTDAYFNDNMPGNCDFRLSSQGDGDEIIHMVRVRGFRGKTPPPTPTWPTRPKPTWPPTPTPTATPPTQTPLPLDDLEGRIRRLEEELAQLEAIIRRLIGAFQ